jgi:hypothetical protein
MSSGDLRFSVSVDDLPEVEDEKKPAGAAWDIVSGRPSVSPFLPGEEALPEAVEAGGDPEIEIVYERSSPRRGREVEIDVDTGEIDRLRAEVAAERGWRQQTREAAARANDRDAIAAEYHAELQRIADAKARYADAAAYARYDEQGEIAAEISARLQLKSQLEEAHGNLTALAVIPPLPQQTDQIEAWIAANNLLPADANYLRERKGFINQHPDNAELLLSAAKLAEKRYQLQPGSQEYHDFLDREAGVADADNVPTSQPRQAKRQQGGPTKRPMAAPGSRSSSRSPGGNVFLSDFDQKTARELGISLQDYAKKYKSQAAKGQLSREAAGGRLHSTYVSGSSFEDHY